MHVRTRGSAIVVLAGMACGGGGGTAPPGQLGEACSNADPCGTGLACEVETCVGAFTFDGEVGSVFPGLSGDLTVALLPADTQLAGVTCGTVVSSSVVSGPTFPTRYDLGGVPPGGFMVVAYVRNAANETQAYFGAEQVTVRDDGLVERGGLHLEEVNIAIDGIGPYDCASR